MKKWLFRLEVFFIILIWVWSCNGGFAQTCVTDSPVEVGVKFTVSEPGTITGIRFTRCNNSSYVAKLYSGTTLLAAVNTTGQGSITVPVSYRVIPGVVYTASYFTQGSYQAVNASVWPKVQSQVTYSMSAYRYGNNNTVPVQTYQTSNYFISVDYVKDGLPVNDTVIIRDTIVLPCYPPDSSIIITNGSNIEKYFYFFDTIETVKVIRDTVNVIDTVVINDTIYRVDTVRIDNYLHDTIQLACIDTLHALYGWDAYDSTNYLPHYKDFKIVELPTFDGKRIRYVHKIVEAIRREEWDEVTGTWKEK